MTALLARADCRRLPMANQSVHMVATSPPYWALRDYGMPNQIGLEARPDCLGWARGENCGECYVCITRLWAAEVWRVLRDDGTFWINLGDSYGSNGRGTGGNRVDTSPKQITNRGSYFEIEKSKRIENDPGRWGGGGKTGKQLQGIPWRVALALQADGWVLRSAAPWVKRSAMPESVTDRPSSSLEYVFLLAKSQHYYFDMAAVKQRGANNNNPAGKKSRMRVDRDPAHGTRKQDALDKRTWTNFNDRWREAGENGALSNGRNWRNSDLWFDSVGMLILHDEIVGFDVLPQAYRGCHFATFPEALVEPMILAGTSERGCCPECGAQWVRVVEKGDIVPDTGYENTIRKAPKLVTATEANYRSANVFKDGYQPNAHRETITTGWQPGCAHDLPPIPCTVLDPFAGTFTTGRVAIRLGRKAIGFDLQKDYFALATERTNHVQIRLPT